MISVKDPGKSRMERFFPEEYSKRLVKEDGYYITLSSGNISYERNDGTSSDVPKDKLTKEELDWYNKIEDERAQKLQEQRDNAVEFAMNDSAVSSSGRRSASGTYIMTWPHGIGGPKYRAVQGTSLGEAWSNHILDVRMTKKDCTPYSVWLDTKDVVAVGEPREVGYVLNKKTGFVYYNESGHTFRDLPVKPIESYYGVYQDENDKYHLRDVEGNITQADMSHKRVKQFKALAKRMQDAGIECNTVGMRFLTNDELKTLSSMSKDDLQYYDKGYHNSLYETPENVDGTTLLALSKVMAPFEKYKLVSMHMHPESYINQSEGSTVDDVMKQFDRNRAYFAGADLSKEMVATLELLQPLADRAAQLASEKESQTEVPPL